MVNYVIITVLCVWHTVSLSAQPFLQFLIQFSISTLCAFTAFFFF